VNLKERIKQHEGCRLTPYKDSLNITTVGYGRNLEAVPFSQDEVDLMFENDFERAWMGAMSFPEFDGLNDVRRGVVVEMTFQMGRKGVAGFRKFWAAVRREDWLSARHQLLSSRWAVQTPERAKELAEIFFNG